MHQIRGTKSGPLGWEELVGALGARAPWGARGSHPGPGATIWAGGAAARWSHGLARGQQVPLPGGGRAGVRRVKAARRPLPLLSPSPTPPPPRTSPRGAGLGRSGGPGRGLTSAGGASPAGCLASDPPGSRRARCPWSAGTRPGAGKMAKRLCAGSALCVRGPRGPAPLLLVGLALLGTARAREEAGGGFSLHPPYFNLAEGARIAASATCGEEAPARGSPRPTEDLYCKLVGGPVAGGDPNQTIQVSAGRAVGRPPGALGPGTPARPQGERRGPGRVQVRTLWFRILGAQEGTPTRLLRLGRETSRPSGKAEFKSPAWTRGRPGAGPVRLR